MFCQAFCLGRITECELCCFVATSGLAQGIASSRVEGDAFRLVEGGLMRWNVSRETPSDGCAEGEALQAERDAGFVESPARRAWRIASRGRQLEKGLPIIGTPTHLFPGGEGLRQNMCFVILYSPS